MDYLNELRNWTCVGVVMGPYGVTGGLKIKSFCEIPSAIKNYNPIKIEGFPETHDFKIISKLNDTFKVKSEKIKDKKAAQAFKGKLLFAARNKLPKPNEDEYYFTDLIGLRVRSKNESFFGIVKNVENYGAGTFLEIRDNKTCKTTLLPFSKELIPVVNLKQKYIVLKKTPDEFLKVRS